MIYYIHEKAIKLFRKYIFIFQPTRPARRLNKADKIMFNVKILTVDEMRKINGSIEYQYSTLDFIDLFIISTNDENPYEGVIYKNGEMWVFGGQFDSQVSSLKDMLEQIASGDN